jgi:hypothetical protein
MLVGPVSTNARHVGRNVTRACLSLEPFRGGWCRAVVVDAMGRRAWSNPLWLDR